MKIYIKDMKCPAFKFFVQSELTKMGLNFENLTMNEVDIIGNITEKQLNQLNTALHSYGLNVITANESFIVRKIKVAINHLLYRSVNDLKLLLPVYVNRSNINYSSLEMIFKKEVSKTIEEYYLQRKDEKAKELSTYYKLTPIEISYQLGYESLQNLSNPAMI